MRVNTISLCAAICFLCVFPTTATEPKEDLSYQKRGNRNEGRLDRNQLQYSPLVDLISARVDFNEPSVSSNLQPILPQKLKIAFTLPQQSEATLIVREIKPKHNYYMNTSSYWMDGSHYKFEWPTYDVLAKLQYKQMYNLGVVARIGNRLLTVDNIAPVIFYHSNLPTKVDAYRFVFKTKYDADLKLTLVHKQGRTIKNTSPARRYVLAGEAPISVVYAVPPESGSYSLEIVGICDTGNGVEKVTHSINFYHQPRF